MVKSMSKRKKQKGGPVKSLTFTVRNYPEVVDFANKLAADLRRNPHDAMREFIVEAENNKDLKSQSA